jgi:hypothetical protein
MPRSVAYQVFEKVCQLVDELTAAVGAQPPPQPDAEAQPEQSAAAAEPGSSTAAAAHGSSADAAAKADADAQETTEAEGALNGQQRAEVAATTASASTYPPDINRDAAAAAEGERQAAADLRAGDAAGASSQCPACRLQG